jgi:hypothetical protein
MIRKKAFEPKPSSNVLFDYLEEKKSFEFHINQTKSKYSSAAFTCSEK